MLLHAFAYRWSRCPHTHLLGRSGLGHLAGTTGITHASAAWASAIPSTFPVLFAAVGGIFLPGRGDRVTKRAMKWSDPSANIESQEMVRVMFEHVLECFTRKHPHMYIYILVYLHAVYIYILYSWHAASRLSDDHGERCFSLGLPWPWRANVPNN